MYYCEKCAILLASRGFAVKKLDDDQYYNSKSTMNTIKKTKNSR